MTTNLDKHNLTIHTILTMIVARIFPLPAGIFVWDSWIVETYLLYFLSSEPCNISGKYLLAKPHAIILVFMFLQALTPA